MNEENTRKIFEAFPDMFRGRNMTVRENLMPFGFACGDGWFDLIYQLCTDITAELDKPENEGIAERFIVLQVKEKFAGLRFYVGSATEAIFDLIHKAEADSYEICERCGEPGLCRMGSWYRTLCDRHAEEMGQTALAKMR